MDIDDFRSINDAHGHLAGDDVLRQLAAKIRDVHRLGDVAARCGGEEFAILLPHTTMHGARALADRLLHGIRTIGVADRHVTVSIGIAAWAPSEEAGALLARAEEALHTAKRDGRDQAREAPGGER
jgi:diguanylate cyclase (GGDEF)-like protein